MITRHIHSSRKILQINLFSRVLFVISRVKYLSFMQNEFGSFESSLFSPLCWLSCRNYKNLSSFN